MDTICDKTVLNMHSIHNCFLKSFPGYGTKYFNGSVVEYRGRIYFAYRTEHRPYFLHPRIHICELDQTLVPKSDHYTLEVKGNSQGWRLDFRIRAEDINRAEDPRLVVHQDRLYVFFCDGFKMAYAPVIISSEQAIRLGDIVYPKPPGLAMDRNHDGREKNWSPVSYKGHLWVLYCMQPNIVFMNLTQTDGQGQTQTQTMTHRNKFNWKWGYLKGGTPLVKHGNKYYTFFHSTRVINGHIMYFMGAMTFDSDLKPLQISRYPIAAPVPDGDPGRISKNSYVLFPAGVLVNSEQQRFEVSLGYNDYCNKMLYITFDELDYNLSS